MKNFFKNKRGAMAILSISIILIAAISASGFITVFQRITIMNEAQGIMDMAGPIALRKGLDTNKWLLEEEMVISNQTLVRQRYSELLEGNLNISGGLLRYEILRLQVFDKNHPTAKSLGLPSGDREQYYVEAILALYVEKPSGVSFAGNTAWNFYNFFASSESQRYASISGNPSPNEDVLFVRSVTRLVLR